MDEVLFRSSQKLESLQIQLGMVAAEGKNLLQNYAEHGKVIVRHLTDSNQMAHSRDVMKNFYHYIVMVCKETRDTFFTFITMNSKKCYDGLLQLFGKQLSRRDIYFLSIGFICGGMVGVGMGVLIFKKHTFHHYMQAVQCLQYTGIESASVVEDAVAPHDCGKNEVLVNVKAASVHIIDAQICNGYGYLIRKLLDKQQRNKSGLPITLGRDCTGIITDIGSSVTRLEVGEEVWLTVPFWASGTMCQTVLVPENRVSRKPKNIGYESACSLPYAGCIAMTTLKKSGLTANNAKSKKVLVVDGCTPVGCVLIQLLKFWGAHVTVACYKRASPVAKALGANCVLTMETDLEETLKSLRKEMELRDPFTLIVCTKMCLLPMEEFKKFCQPDGLVLCTMPPILKSDSYGFFMRFMFGAYFRIRCTFESLLNVSSGYFDETHMCYNTLDQLKDFVQSGHLQTVVDKVYHPQDIETALSHIQSFDAIGSTIITFR